MRIGIPVELFEMKRLDDLCHLDAYQTAIGTAKMFANEQDIKNDVDKALETKCIPEDKILVNHLPVWYNFCNSTKVKWSCHHCSWQIKYSGVLGMQYLVVHPGFRHADGGDPFSNLVESLVKLIPQLEQENITLLLENCAGNGVDSQYGIVDEILNIMDVIQDPHIGLCFDTCHGWAYGEDMLSEKFWVEKASRAEVFHFNMPKFLERGSKKDRHASSSSNYHTLFPEQFVNPIIRDRILILENCCDLEANLVDVFDIKERLYGKPS